MLANEKSAQGFEPGQRVVITFRAELTMRENGATLRAKLPNGGYTDIPWNAELANVLESESMLNADDWWAAELNATRYPELRAHRDAIARGYITQPSREAYAFFLAQSSGDAEAAQNLTYAEAVATARGWDVGWEGDGLVGSHVAEFPDAYSSEPATCETATLRDADGRILASLGCVDDATDDYRRLVAAQLANEVVGA